MQSDLFSAVLIQGIHGNALCDATFSPCRTYRYALWRRWGTAVGGNAASPQRGSYAMFVCLNPSTADELNNDPTIVRCINFAKAWGFDGLCMANLFAFRATQPADMKAAADPIGPDNDAYLRSLSLDAGIVVAGWGVHGTHRGRAQAVRAMLPRPHHLRLTKDGHPGHPLYLPATLKPVAWMDA